MQAELSLILEVMDLNKFLTMSNSKLHYEIEMMTAYLLPPGTLNSTYLVLPFSAMHVPIL